MYRSLALLIVIAAAMTAVASNANAACKRSCTNVAEVCVQMGASRPQCFADMKSCLKTGNLHMPSGRVFTNLCKK
jgi:hypothetical protein